MTEKVTEAEPTPVMRKGYTPPKGRKTPKRVQAGRRVIAAPVDRKTAVRQRREALRAERAERVEGMRRGDERYLPPRDKGPERALVRDLVDRRRTAGTWFFGGTLVVILGSSAAMPPTIQLAANALLMVLTLALIVDSFFIARTIRREIRKRFPKTEQRMGSLYMYGITRAMTFRRLRIPRPRVAIGDRV